MPGEVKLKLCPFCRGEGSIYGIGADGHTVKCRECLASIGCYHHSPKEAVAAWNRRAPEPGTSVVRWVRYDGRPETLPEIIGSRSRAVVFMGKQDMLVVWMKKIQWFSADREPKVGDLWAYLPEPPEGMG